MSLFGRLVANRWAFAPVALLGATVVIATVTVMSAVVGHPLGMEPAYDAKAASWDAERMQRAANDRLRWVVTPEIGSAGALRTLVVRIEDKHAARIEGASVVVECIPNRAAESRANATLVALEPGVYRGDFSSPIGGQWEFRIRVTRESEVYTDSFRRFLTAARPVAKGDSHG